MRSSRDRRTTEWRSIAISDRYLEDENNQTEEESLSSSAPLLWNGNDPRRRSESISHSGRVIKPLAKSSSTLSLVPRIDMSSRLDGFDPSPPVSAKVRILQESSFSDIIIDRVFDLITESFCTNITDNCEFSLISP